MNNITSTFSITSTPVSPMSVQVVRFWTYLFSNILSLLCTLFNLFYLMIDRKLRRALHNHVVIVLLVLGLFYESTNIPWILYNDHNGSPVIRSEIFYRFWTFINYPFYSLQVELFAWATIERHILIFHEHWLATKSRRFLLHYAPMIVITIYYLIYYSLVYLAPFCRGTFDAFLAGGIHIPCVFNRTVLGVWDIVFHQVVPTLVIVSFSLALLFRVIFQKNRLRQGIRWEKHKKIMVQLLSISTIYILFNGPWVVIIFSYQYGLSESIATVALVYTGFLNYYVIFLFPFVCCFSLPELRAKLKEKLCFFQRRPRTIQQIVCKTTKQPDPHLPAEDPNRTCITGNPA